MYARNFSMPGESNFPRLFLFFLSFSFFLFLTVAPLVYVGDCGNFSTASFFLGSVHPPCYPLYVSLGKFMTFLPFGNIAMKVNLLAAVFGALTVVMASEVVFYITKNYIISLFILPVLLASPDFILQSSQAKGVYTLNAFLITLIFYLCLRALKGKGFFKSLLLSFFLLGLGMGNHQTIGFMLIPMLFVVLARRKELPSGTVAISLVLSIAGFSIYLYLYLRSLADTFANYVPVYSLTNFVAVLLRVGYSANTLDTIKTVGHFGETWFYGIKNISMIIADEIHPVLWPFILAGMIGLWKERKVFWFVCASLLTWVFFAKLTIGTKEANLSVAHPYFLQTIPILAIIAATGLSKAYEKIKVSSTLVAKTTVAGLILFQLVLIPISLRASSLSDYYMAYGLVKDISKVLKQKSFYLAFGDNPSFLSFYGFGVERLRDDVFIMDAPSGGINFRLYLSPQWKFATWYPELYVTQGMSVKFFYPFAKEGRVYASAIGSVPQAVRDKFDARQYVLTTILLSKDNSFPFIQSYEKDFRKIDYLSAVANLKQRDRMEFEVARAYMLAVWEYAGILAHEDNKDADYYYRVAILLANRGFRNRIIEDYVSFLANKKSIQEAEKFLSGYKESISDEDERKDVEKMERDLEEGKYKYPGKA
jgi:hypothetical protein